MTTDLQQYNLDSYRELVSRLSPSRVDFLPFSEGTSTRRAIRLRFDLDCEPAWCSQLVKVNQALGVRGTFFVLLTSPFYNPLTPVTLTTLRCLAEAGQWIALHYHHMSGNLDIERLESEYAILRKIAPGAQRVVAWHNPSGDLAPLNRAAREAGFVSAYDEKFVGSLRYFSDSNAKESPRELLQRILGSTEPCVQVLLHPVNWVLGGKDGREILLRTLAAKIDQMTDVLSANHLWQGGLGEKVKRELHTLTFYRTGRQ